MQMTKWVTSKYSFSKKFASMQFLKFTYLPWFLILYTKKTQKNKRKKEKWKLETLAEAHENDSGFLFPRVVLYGFLK